MLKIKEIPIRNGILNHLKRQQDAIDALPSYKEQVQKSKGLWQSKKKSKSQKSAFNRVEKELQKIHFTRFTRQKTTLIEQIFIFN